MAKEVPVLCSKDCACANGRISEILLQQCAAYPRVVSALNTFFKFTCFRPGQLEALLPILHGQDTFVRLPTGGGKSLCMFIVPLCYELDVLGIIISPLNGLMDEQVVMYKKMCCQMTSSCV